MPVIVATYRVCAEGRCRLFPGHRESASALVQQQAIQRIGRKNDGPYVPEGCMSGFVVEAKTVAFSLRHFSGLGVTVLEISILDVFDSSQAHGKGMQLFATCPCRCPQQATAFR